MNKKERRALREAELANRASESSPEPTEATEPIAEGAVPEVATTEPVAKRLGLGLCGLPAMRRMDFQDALLESNRVMRLTDGQLSILMEIEHPWGCSIPLAYVRGIRRLYNAGTHTKGQVKPTLPSVAFNADGRELTARGRVVGEAEPVAAVEEPVVEDAPETEAVNS